ncbi:MAG TPA: chemotaxis protein CheW [Ramlibacter sp.]|nr:chemotaxis protein CheW [Ramlibacter sp.]
MNDSNTIASQVQVVVFRLDDQRYAAPMALVERVIPAVEVTPVPGAPDAVRGVIDIAGRMTPVFCLRRKFGMADRAPRPADQFILVKMARERVAAIMIDEVEGVFDCPQGALCDADAITPALESFAGLARLEDGLVLIHDPQRFLSPDQERALDAAMGAAA